MIGGSELKLYYKYLMVIVTEYIMLKPILLNSLQYSKSETCSLCEAEMSGFFLLEECDFHVECFYKSVA